MAVAFAAAVEELALAVKYYALGRPLTEPAARAPAAAAFSSRSASTTHEGAEGRGEACKAKPWDGRGFREIYAIYDDRTVRVYQAYNDAIADAAVAANSFHAPMSAGLWDPHRMTWIKPSAVWMAYRCGWSTLKDKNQARVLALDVSRKGFEDLLMGAMLSHGEAKGKCKRNAVTVQWDPERVMHPGAPADQVLTRKLELARSIQIGLRGDAVQRLLDPAFLLKITDVTPAFRAAGEALSASPPDVQAAEAALWPSWAEAEMEVPKALRAVLKMDCSEDA